MSGEYEAFLKKKEVMTKLAQRRHDKQMLYEEQQRILSKMPLDYSIYSTEDEVFSDYELEEKDLYPNRDS